MTVILAHITFCTPYVVLSVLPRLGQLNPNIYEAALDLGATPFQALIKVIVPAISSGIVSGFFLAVTLSLDDYFIATYTKPATFDTISTYVVNATKGSQTEIKTALWALSTVMFVVVVAVTLLANRPSKKEGNGDV
jgi:spermidine/putrescine transport system permease protein